VARDVAKQDAEAEERQHEQRRDAPWRELQGAGSRRAGVRGGALLCCSVRGGASSGGNGRGEVPLCGAVRALVYAP